MCTAERMILDMNSTAFVTGFEYILRDFAAGLTWEASFDLLCTPAEKRPQAMRDGGRAACEALAGWLDVARKLGKAHGVPVATVEELIARTRIA